MALDVAVGRLWHVESVFDWPTLCVLEVNSMVLLLIAPIPLKETGGKLGFVSAIVASDTSKRKKKRVKGVM